MTTIQQSSPLPPAVAASAETAQSKESLKQQQQQVKQVNNLLGILPRAFDPWPKQVELPCVPAESDWYSTKRQNKPSKEGFLYIKLYKTASSTASGINLRIARNVAHRRNSTAATQQLPEGANSRSPSSSTPPVFTYANPTIDKRSQLMCKARFDHGPWKAKRVEMIRDRNKTKSFLWTILRDPTKQVTSHFFYSEVSRNKLEPTDKNFQHFCETKGSDYIYALKPTTEPIDDGENSPVQHANAILNEFNFVGVTERLEETAVLLMMLLDLPMADFLFLSVKSNGGYDDVGIPGKCTYLWPSFVSPGMKEYFASETWKTKIQYGLALYHAVHRSMDLTIDQLGRDKVQQNVEKFRMAQAVARERCFNITTFPCSEGGHVMNRTDCIWKDSACGVDCLDQVATDLELW